MTNRKSCPGCADRYPLECRTSFNAELGYETRKYLHHLPNGLTIECVADHSGDEREPGVGEEIA